MRFWKCVCFLLLCMSCKKNVRDLECFTAHLAAEEICVSVPDVELVYIDTFSSEWDVGLSQNYQFANDTFMDIGFLVTSNEKMPYTQQAFDYHLKTEYEDISRQANVIAKSSIRYIDNKKFGYTSYVIPSSNYRSDNIFTIYDGKIYNINIGNRKYKLKDSSEYNIYVDSILSSVHIE